MVEAKKDKKEEEGKKYRVKSILKELTICFRYLLGSQRTKKEGIFSQKRLLESSLSLKTTESPFQSQETTVLTLQIQTQILKLQFTRSGFSEVEGLTDPTHMTQLTRISKMQLSKPGRIQRINRTSIFARK